LKKIQAGLPLVEPPPQHHSDDPMVGVGSDADADGDTDMEITNDGAQPTGVENRVSPK